MYSLDIKQAVDKINIGMGERILKSIYFVDYKYEKFFIKSSELVKLTKMYNQHETNKQVME